MSDKWDGRIIHEAVGGLSREVWQFILIPQMGRAVQLDLRLDYYETETRQTRRPACALLQAVARADTHFLQEIWPPVTWLEQPTATMQCVTGTRAEWERVAQREMA